jgi:hypothetical protein
MAIRFGDLYEEMITLEEAIERMKIDIENADCDSATKCILENELEMLEQKYYNISRTDFDFEKLNFVTIVESIERCLHCIDFAGDFSDIAPPPYAVASTCGSKKVQLTLDDFEKIIVYELTSSSPPHTSNKHEFVKSAMPYVIETRASERYVVTYDSLRKGISVKGFNRVADKSVSGFGNIAQVEVVLTPPAQQRYGVERLAACKVLLTTPTPMTSASPLTRAVDGNINTAPIVSQTKQSEVELVFQFFV